MRKHIMLDRKKEPVKAVKDNTRLNHVAKNKATSSASADNHLTSVITKLATSYLRNVLGCRYEYCGI